MLSLQYKLILYLFNHMPLVMRKVMLPISVIPAICHCLRLKRKILFSGRIDRCSLPSLFQGEETPADADVDQQVAGDTKSNASMTHSEKSSATSLASSEVSEDTVVYSMDEDSSDVK